ncbi:MAG: hypothetical protein AXW14_10125 [Alteromonas sp. Nap_26]|nr:MAG: hypothetical protein AXW14_10125 [Alteromonas sp. Nap_26]
MLHGALKKAKLTLFRWLRHFKQYDALLEKAMHAQRNGDIKTYSMLTAKSEALWKEIERLENPK